MAADVVRDDITIEDTLVRVPVFAHIVTEDAMTTPPLPSSSPAPVMETMEMSPLPHKPPFIVTTEIELNPPTPGGSPIDSPMMSAAPSPLQESPLMGPKEDKQE
jgi:M-phase inducer tyrosine phosphatase